MVTTLATPLAEAIQPRALVDSYLRWWRDAGAVDAVGDDPFDWRAVALPSPSVTRASPTTSASMPAGRPVAATPPPLPTPAPAEAAPGDIEAFDAWLAQAEVAGGRDGRRILPTGPADAPLMLLGDLPDERDLVEGRLFAGEEGALLDAMLRAIGLERSQVRLATLATTRAPGGRLDPRSARELVDLAARHIAVARPKTLILMGQQTCEISTGTPLGVDIAQRDFNHPGVTVAPFAIHHPRMLLKQPVLKRQTWEVLKSVRELIQA